MATIITTDFGIIHDALNKLIIGEVKAALKLVSEQWMQGPSLCRIVVSKNDDYVPKDVAVDNVWLHNDKLYFDGHLMPLPDDGNDDPEQYEGDEDDSDWLDITDFHYLIEQCKDKMPDGEHNLRSGEDLNAFADAFCKSMLNY